MISRLILIGVLLGATACADVQPIEDQRKYGPVTTLKDWFTSVHVMPYSDGALLFDAGFRQGAVQRGLEQQGLTPADITHVFITHGHGDHIGALSLFPNAIRVGLAQEKTHIEEESDGTQTLDMAVDDGDLFLFDDIIVEAISLPGHTTGNAAYRVGTVVLLGDSAIVTRDGALAPVPEKRSEDPQRAADSLKKLHSRLVNVAPPVEWLIPAHSGGVAGLTALKDYSE